MKTWLVNEGRWSVCLVAAAAFLVRVSRWPTIEAAVLSGNEYDPAVMYAGAASLLFGQLPYVDFVYLHPPGSLLLFVPFAAFGGVAGDAAGLAAARYGIVLLGTLNALLVGLLLRRYGTRSVLVGGGLYAAWGALAFTEQLPLLEPPLMTALLVSLLLVRSSRRCFHVLAGVALGVAVMVKVWAAVDLVLLGLMVWSMWRFRSLAAFVVGGALGGSLLALPFFLRAPAAMWEMVVSTQLGRPRDGTDLLTRAATFGPLPWVVSHPVYVALAVALASGLLLVAVALVWHFAVRRRNDERLWWAGVALMHAGVIALAPSFYHHYAMFVAGPLCLVVGGAVGLVEPAVSPARKLWQRAFWWVSWTLVVVFAVISVAFSAFRAIGIDPPLSSEERRALAEWAKEHRCVSVELRDRVRLSQVTSALAAGCPFEVDGFGARLLVEHRGGDVVKARADAQWAEISAATSVILSGDLGISSPFGPDRTQEFQARFVEDGVIADRWLWVETK